MFDEEEQAQSKRRRVSRSDDHKIAKWMLANSDVTSSSYRHYEVEKEMMHWAAYVNLSADELTNAKKRLKTSFGLCVCCPIARAVAVLLLPRVEAQINVRSISVGDALLPIHFAAQFTSPPLPRNSSAAAADKKRSTSATRDVTPANGGSVATAVQSEEYAQQTSCPLPLDEVTCSPKCC